MDNRQKIINAIKNREVRLKELSTAKRAALTAQVNSENADKDLARQIKNAFGFKKPVVYDGQIYTVYPCCDDPSGCHLKIAPAEFEILEFAAAKV